MIPANRISPAAQKLMGLLRQAPRRFLPSTTSSAPSNNYLAATDFAFNRTTTDEKIDWHATDKFSMFGHRDAVLRHLRTKRASGPRRRLR
jgi:hypothetical protein